MSLLKLNELLQKNAYPGRSIVFGKSKDGKNAVIAYFIMGRSENSRNRIFTPVDGGIRTQAFDESKLTDPSLIIYAPIRLFEDATIVTNGDQTDTIYDYMKKGDTFENALRSRTFEPDEPIFTPRISGVVFPNGDYKLSILKSSFGNADSTQRFFYEYSNTLCGQGHFIHTYKRDGNPVPSFEGEPEPVEISGEIDEFTDMIWSSLNEENKVSLFTRFINLETGKSDSRIVNKNK